MSPIQAIYQGGVFKPLGPVNLPENQRVELRIQPVVPNDARAWLERVQQRQQKIIAERGFFPDSTPDIAADRARDE